MRKFMPTGVFEYALGSNDWAIPKPGWKMTAIASEAAAMNSIPPGQANFFSTNQIRNNWMALSLDLSSLWQISNGY
jgi:hypothetical protein